jgi:hypothetical protein
MAPNTLHVAYHLLIVATLAVLAVVTNERLG